MEIHHYSINPSKMNIQIMYNTTSRDIEIRTVVNLISACVACRVPYSSTHSKLESGKQNKQGYLQNICDIATFHLVALQVSFPSVFKRKFYRWKMIFSVVVLPSVPVVSFACFRGAVVGRTDDWSKADHRA